MINDSLITLPNLEKGYFTFLSDFADCLGSIVSKKVCLENEIEKLAICGENIKFSIQQHLAFLVHCASLFYSNFASEIKILDQIIKFSDWIYKEDLLFSTKDSKKLSFGSIFLSTIDYGRHVKKIDQKINFSRSDIKESLENTEEDIVRFVSFVFNWFRFDNIYQSFHESDGFMKKIVRLPGSFETSIYDAKNKKWLNNELENLIETKGFKPLFNYKNNASTKVTVKFIGDIPDKLKAVMRMFAQRYVSKCIGGDKEITVEIAKLDDCDTGNSSVITCSRWNIKLAQDMLEKMINKNDVEECFYYFHIIKTFLHELAHLVNQDSYERFISDDKEKKIQHEWRADQFFSLFDKDAAEIFFAKTVLLLELFTVSSQMASEIHPSSKATALRDLDIAKHHDLIPSEIINGRRNFNLSDIEHIFLKHGINKGLDEFRNAASFYQEHKNDNYYESFPDPNDDCKELEPKKKEKMRHLRNQ